jgi:hypothetical protein
VRREIRIQPSESIYVKAGNNTNKTKTDESELRKYTHLRQAVRHGRMTACPAQLVGNGDKWNEIMNDEENNNYLLTYDSYSPVYYRFHRGEWITWASGGEGALDTPGPLNDNKRSEARPNSWTKSRQVLRAFLLAIQNHLYSFALRFLFLQTHTTSYSFYSSVTVHCKGERRKIW